LGESSEAHNSIILVGPARYTHALPGDLERARKLFDAYLAVEANREATG